MRRHPDTGALAIIPPMQRIPTGTFLMGSDLKRDPDALPSECPQHRVYLPSYYVGRYPVTVAEYACALEAGADGLEAPTNWGKQSAFSANPVYGLTWFDTLAYAHWLSEITRLNWRLPSEAEWEKAARGADGSIYPWGDLWDASRTNAEGELAAIYAHPLGASPYGVFDLVGAVPQWTSTIMEDGNVYPYHYPYRVTDGREDLAAHAWMRILRGGSFGLAPRLLRAATRNWFSTWDRYDWLIGMRLALSGDTGKLLR